MSINKGFHASIVNDSLRLCGEFSNISYTFFIMDTRKIIKKAELVKTKNHRLSFDLRLKSIPEAKKFLREHAVVLWDVKAEIPNLLDATLGRIANDRERTSGKSAENCSNWRTQILQDPEFLDCPFFRKISTSLHEDLWPFVTVVSKHNREKALDSSQTSKEAKRVVSLLSKEGRMTVPELQKALRCTTPSEKRQLQKTRRELNQMLILISGADGDDLWENRMSKAIRGRADQIGSVEARKKLISATLRSSILCPEKNISRWFGWLNGDATELKSVLDSREFVRIEQQKTSWILPRNLIK